MMCLDEMTGTAESKVHNKIEMYIFKDGNNNNNDIIYIYVMILHYL